MELFICVQQSAMHHLFSVVLWPANRNYVIQRLWKLFYVTWELYSINIVYTLLPITQCWQNDCTFVKF